MKASDFQGCVKSMSGQKENNLTINSEYQKAITLFREGDSLKANKLIKTFLKKNPNSKDGWILKALINSLIYLDHFQSIPHVYLICKLLKT